MAKLENLINDGPNNKARNAQQKMTDQVASKCKIWKMADQNKG